MLGVEMSVLFESMHFAAYSFPLTDSFCPIYLTCDLVSLVEQNFLAGSE